MPIAYPEASSQIRNTLIAQAAGLDLPDRRQRQPICGIGGCQARCKLRPTAETGSISCDLGGCRMPKKLAILECGAFGTTDRPAVNPRRFHRDKKVPIEPWITCDDRLVALIAVQLHTAKLAQNWILVSPFSDMKIAGRARSRLREARKSTQKWIYHRDAEPTERNPKIFLYLRVLRAFVVKSFLCALPNLSALPH